MMRGKIWGTTEAMIVTPLFAMHRLTIFPNSVCSWHVHRHKNNAFVVLSGEVYIDVESSDYALTDVTRLAPEEMTTVKPGEHHRFRTRAIGCTMLEMYYCEPLSEDIVRRDHGSRLDPENKIITGLKEAIDDMKAARLASEFSSSASMIPPRKTTVIVKGRRPPRRVNPLRK